MTSVAIEAPHIAWVPIDRWVRGGRGSIDSLLLAQGFWFWNTIEMKAMLTALRTWNLAPGRRRAVRVVGVDPKYADRSLTAALSGFASLAPSLVDRFSPTRAGLPATRAEFMAWLTLSPQAQDSLIAPLLAMPVVVDSAAGAQRDGGDTSWQQLRWNARVLAHRVQMQREDRGNWASADVGAEITLYIRASASLSTALDAVRRSAPGTAAELAQKLAPVSGSYLDLWRDYTMRWTVGKRTKLRSAAAALVAAVAAVPTGDSAASRQSQSAAADVQEMLVLFDKYAGRPVPPRAARDTAMADLVALAASEDGDAARVVVWAHDYHASRSPISFFENTTMAGALAQRFPDRVRSVGFAFGEGSFLAEWYPLPGETLPLGVRAGGVREFRVPRGAAASGEAQLARLARGTFALDLRGANSGWIAAEQSYQRYGTGYNDAWFAQSRLRSRATTSFDWLVFIPRVTAATLLK